MGYSCSVRASGTLFGCVVFWHGKCDRAFVDGLMVRVDQFKGQFVGAWGKTLQDDWVSTRICPHPRGIVESHMNVSDARRDSQGVWAEHRRNVQVLSTILDNHHAPRGERFGQRRIDEDIRGWLRGAGERDHPGESTSVRRVLCHSSHGIQHDGCYR